MVAYRHALLLCPHCCVIVPYCHCVVVACGCCMWLSCTINNNKQWPMLLFVIWLAHPLPLCLLPSIIVWWSSCGGVVCCGHVSAVTWWCCGSVHKIYHDDDLGHCSVFGPHHPVATWHQVVVLITEGWGQAVSIDYSPRTKMMNKLFVAWLPCCCQQCGTVSCVLIFWG